MKNSKFILKVIMLLILILLAAALCYTFMPFNIDWTNVFRPASLLMLSGKSPYNNLPTIMRFYNPPWVLIPLMPIALLPQRVGDTVLFFVSISCYFIIAKRLKAKKLSILFLIFSLPVLIDLMTGNITWLCLLGYIMPPQIGLFFVLMKPQVGGFVAIYWFVEAWRKGGYKLVTKTFLPVSIAFIVSFILYGLWIKDLPIAIDLDANMSFYPYLIPIGILLLLLSLRQYKINLAYIGAPFIAPYVCMNSYGTVMLGFLGSVWLTLIASVASWFLGLKF